MSMRRRSARRHSDAAAAMTATQTHPGLDRAFVISFLELDPEVAAALNGGVVEPPVVASVPLNHTEAPAYPPLEIVPAAPAAPAPAAEPQPEPRVIDVAATAKPVAVEPVFADFGEPRPPKRQPSRRKPVRSRAPKAKTRKQSPARRRFTAVPEPAGETGDALVELLSPVHPEQAAAAVAVETEMPAPAAVSETEYRTEQQLAAIVDAAPMAPPAPAAPAPDAPPKRLPVEYIDHEKLMKQVAVVGWKIPPAPVRQWSYMNFTLPPSPTANMTPKQAARYEWRSMLKYYRINPYKAHHREDRKEAKRLLSQLRRARLDVA